MKIKKTFLVLAALLLLVFLMGLTGCGTDANYNTQTDGEQQLSKYDELTEILDNTYFETDGIFKDMTFGEVIEELIRANPNENDITYKINENIADFNTVKSKLGNFDAGKYDYISALIGFDMSNNFEYGDILFSVDKETKEVVPIAISSNGQDWEFSGSNLIIDSWYLLFAIAISN